ncbi:hypothetical protein N2W54_001863 [Lotmaria passim]
MESNSPEARKAAPQHATAILEAPSASLLEPRRSPRTLFDLDFDVFDYLCAFVPVDDLLFQLPAVSREARRRVWANQELWQQLWMRYLVQFFRSLIPPSSVPSSAGSFSSPSVSPWPIGVVDTTSMVSTASCSDAAWRLYHYHVSKEPRPRVELLERLSLIAEDISDPPTEETPKSVARAVSASGSGGMAPSQGTEKAQEQTLLFAQLCATQLVASNLTHVEKAAAPAAAVTAATVTAAAGAVASPSTPSSVATKRERRKDGETISAAAVARRRGRQADRLRRALHFLLSADTHRPAFQDRLWTSTYEAGEAYRRDVRKDSGDASTRRRRRRHQASTKAPPSAVKDHLRPLSWLDDRDHSVKVLLFDDNSRTVGDIGLVQAERIKLLAGVAQHWRLAYAHQFYLTPTDGKEHGSGGATARAAALLRARRVGASAEFGGEGAALPSLPQPRQDGRASWEQIYRRFRDDNGNGHSARIRESLRRVVTAARGTNNDSGASDTSGTAAARTHTIPSSGNPLFDLHLLTFHKRKHFYAAMLASTVEVPDGMGAFFATCVSESFLRWWCWRSRRLYDITATAAEAAAGPSTTTATAAASLASASRGTALTFPTPFSAHRTVPTTLWIARVCSVHKPQYGTIASDGSFGRPAPIEAEESILYSSSFSDVTSTVTLDSDSSSIDFVEEVPDTGRIGPGAGFGAGEEGVDASQSYPGNGMDSNSGSQFQQDGQQNAQEHHLSQQQQSPSSSLSRPSAPRVALLFPLPHMLAYWFMMHHVTFYSYQVYRRMWGDQEVTIAVCSRILGPAGHSVECRLFYTLRCTAFPRMYTKMMFTPGTLPALTLQDKMSVRSPYRSPSATTTSGSASSSASSSSRFASAVSPPLSTPFPLHFTGTQRDSDSDSSVEPSQAAAPQAAAPPPPERSSTTSSEPRRGRHTTLDAAPVDSRQVYDLFWIGFGRVEVESGPTISRSNLVRLRVALGLPLDFPMGLLWNVMMFASGVGPLILKDHRHSLFFHYAKSFTDVVEEEFGEVSCYGYGARPTLPSPADRAMPNPLDAEVALMQEQRNLDEAARALVRELAAAENAVNAASEVGAQNEDADASFSTVEGSENGNGAPPSSGSPTSSLTSSLTTNGSWGMDSQFSSLGGHSTWRDWHTPYSDAL